MEVVNGTKGKIINIKLREDAIPIDELNKTFTIIEDFYFVTDQPYALWLNKPFDLIFYPYEGEKLLFAEVERMSDLRKGFMVWQTTNDNQGFNLYSSIHGKMIGEDLRYLFFEYEDYDLRKIAEIIGEGMGIREDILPILGVDQEDSILEDFARVYQVEKSANSIRGQIAKNIQYLAALIYLLQNADELGNLDHTDFAKKTLDKMVQSSNYQFLIDIVGELDAPFDYKDIMRIIIKKGIERDGFASEFDELLD